MISYFSDLPPMSPSTPMDLDFFRRRPARRALRELGSNDTKLNLKMAESFLTISAEQFLNKWNFDPIKLKPVTGRYVWTAVNGKEQNTTTSTVSPNKDSSCERIPAVADEDKDNVNRLPEEVNKRLSGESDTDSSSVLTSRLASPTQTSTPIATKTPCKVVQSRSSVASPKTIQRKITEFGCQRKRLYSKTEDDIESSPAKKLHLETPTKISMAASV